MRKYRLVELISVERLNTLIDELASRINRDYEGQSVIMIGILKGAFIFMADLARRLTLPVKMDFVRLASYGDSDKSCGDVRITKDVELSLRGSHVIVVEDIVDTGVTLRWLLDHLKSYCPESVRTCALVDKKERRQVELSLDYVGVTIDAGFVVGYGLDFSENHRHLPMICEVVFDEAESGE